MKEYEVEIVETLSRVITVEANNHAEAKAIAKGKYYGEEVVMDEDDYYGVEFFVAIDDDEEKNEQQENK